MNKQRKIRGFLAILFMFLFLGKGVIPAFAASSKIVCYTIATSNTTVYQDTSLKKKLGTVYASDELIVELVTESYSKVTYKITGSNRTKTGYVPTKAILWGTTGSSYTAKGKITTYRRPGSDRYGSVSKGDVVKVLGKAGNWVQIKYPVQGGYKYAVISASDANTYLYGNSSATSQNNTVINTGKTMTNALYGINTSASFITCGFDGYRTTSGRHEGIDLRYGINKPVYALTSGVITSVKFGSVGRNGLSTIAVYNSASGKTVVYLHSKPLSSLYVGKNISAGQQLGTESWRGISSSSSAHTHVEVRNGYKTAAAVSVGDRTLDNPNPTSFWNSQGYRIH